MKTTDKFFAPKIKNYREAQQRVLEETAKSIQSFMESVRNFFEKHGCEVHPLNEEITSEKIPSLWAHHNECRFSVTDRQLKKGVAFSFGPNGLVWTKIFHIGLGGALFFVQETRESDSEALQKAFNLTCKDGQETFSADEMHVFCDWLKS